MDQGSIWFRWVPRRTTSLPVHQVGAAAGIAHWRRLTTPSHTHTDSPGNTVVAWFSRHPCVHSDFDMIIYDNDTGSYVLIYYHQTLSHIIFRRGMNCELDLESWMNPWRSAKKLSIVCLRPTIRLFSSPHGRDSNGCKWVAWTGNYICVMMVMVIYHIIQGV